MQLRSLDLPAALRYLEAHTNLEARAGRIEGLSLDVMSRLMDVLAHPNHAYKVIHVTGTNGKGSVARMVSALLAESGLSVGTYSSPHLTRLNERMSLNLDPVSDLELAAAITDIARLEPLAGVEPSYFEIVTAAALSWFAERAIDVAVVEVGLLGRFDATNVVDADVAAITNIGMDHTDGVGDWRAAIAGEKVGIIKQGSLVVLGDDDPTVRSIVDSEVGSVGAIGVWASPEEFDLVGDNPAVGGRLVDVKTPGGVLEDIYMPVYGHHQAQNLATAIAATEGFFGRPLERDLVVAALAELRLPGRFEIVGHEPLIVLDGAHNPPGAASAAMTMEETFGSGTGVILVVGLLDGRDPEVMLEALDARSASLVIACTPPSPRALPAQETATAARAFGVPVEVVADVSTAVDRAASVAADSDVILVTGSLYVVGAARQALGVG